MIRSTQRSGCLICLKVNSLGLITFWVSPAALLMSENSLRLNENARVLSWS